MNDRRTCIASRGNKLLITNLGRTPILSELPNSDSNGRKCSSSCFLSGRVGFRDYDVAGQTQRVGFKQTSRR